MTINKRLIGPAVVVMVAMWTMFGFTASAHAFFEGDWYDAGTGSFAESGWYDSSPSFTEGSWYDSAPTFTEGDWYNSTPSFTEGSWYDSSPTFTEGNWFDSSPSFTEGDWYNSTPSFVESDWYDAPLADAFNEGDWYTSTDHPFVEGDWYDAPLTDSFAEGDWYDSTTPFHEGDWYTSTDHPFVEGEWHDTPLTDSFAEGDWYDPSPFYEGNWYDADGTWHDADGDWYDADGTWYDADGEWHDADGVWHDADGDWYDADGDWYEVYGPSYTTYSTPRYSHVATPVYSSGVSRGSSVSRSSSHVRNVSNVRNVHNVTNRAVVQRVTTPQRVVSTVQPPLAIRPTCNIWANPSTVPYKGNATIEWSSNGATSASLSGFGPVGLNGSRNATGITNPRVYTLTVTSSGGTNTCSTTVASHSNPLPPIHGGAPSCSLTINPNSVHQGDSAVMTWTVTSNADSLSINNGIGNVPLSGSRTIFPRSTETFVATVRGNGHTNTCSATVGVLPHEYPPVYPPVHPPVHPPVLPPLPPTGLGCVIGTNVPVIQNGQEAILHWSSSADTVSAWLSDGLGLVAPNGTLSVRPETSRHYTLTVSDVFGNTQTCATDLSVGGGAPYVSLSQVPYTGFDGGPMVQALYWSMMVLVAAGAGYIVVGQKGTFLKLFTPAIADATVLHEAVISRADDTQVTPTPEEAITEAPEATETPESSIDTMVLEKGEDGEMPVLRIHRG